MAIGIVVVVAVGIGCGDGSTTSAVVPKAEYIKEAEAVCTQTQDDLRAAHESFTEELEEDGEDPASQANLETRVADVYVPSLKSELEGLEDLPSPDAGRREVQAMLASLSQGRQILEDGVEDAPRAADTLVKFVAQAEAYGLNCTG